MANYDADLTLERIRAALETQRIDDAVSILLSLHPVDQAEVFDLLDEPEQEMLLDRLDIPTTADLLEELEDEDVLEAIESLSTERLADVLDEMEPDEAADLLGDLPPEQASEALAQMEDADEVIPLLGYPDETAGGLMTTSYIALRRHTSAEQAIQFLRQISPETEIPYYLYVIDKVKRLHGVVGLRELVVAEPATTMESTMDHEVIFVTSGTDQEEVARIMTRYDLAAVPVVDDKQRLLGVITHDDILEVLENEATEDVYRLANVADTDLNPQSPIAEQLKGRLPWIYLNAATALFASWVISNFEWLIAQVAILAAFQSVVAALGGNTASQNVAMIVRSLALGKITSKLIWRIMGRQILVGILQGIAVGLVIGIAVTIWRGDPYLGIILGLAMVGNMIVAGIIGTIVPLGLNALGQDPAIASSVFVTAVTDSCGFFIFLSLAAISLNYLT
ncbi:MAG: magnesium transporter [Anaerolineales bacterium]|nr:magnesium transporter [Anaerolineales bacterium]